MAAVQSAISGCIVGNLSCQRDSYLRTLNVKVVSCIPVSTQHDRPQSSKPKTKATDSSSNKSKPAATTPTWLIEFDDSVLFPEDHGTLISLEDNSTEPITVEFVERQGLHCKVHSPQPLASGTTVRQVVNFDRRWDLMQQHTGQHLLTAVMNTYDNLKTLGWGMGAPGEMSYVDLPRKLTHDELCTIQERVNDVIQQNIKITVETPSDADTRKVPDDYDEDKGVIRVIKIGDLDENTCCGTHLQQTSHIALLLLGINQSVSGGRHRQFFIAGNRAIQHATSSLQSIRTISRLLSSSSSSDDLINSVTHLQDTVATLKKHETRLLSDIAGYETDRVKAILKTGKNAFVHRYEPSMDFINIVAASVKNDVAHEGQVVMLASGEGSGGGAVIIIGQKAAVDNYVSRVKEALPSIKGGGKGERWQGKMSEWKAGSLELLRKMTEA